MTIPSTAYSVFVRRRKTAPFKTTGLKYRIRVATLCQMEFGGDTVADRVARLRKELRHDNR